jgi:hypothetical protein
VKTEQTFTPRTWQVWSDPVANSKTILPKFLVMDETEAFVAEVRDADEARLIAACPDLLTSLQWFVAHFVRENHNAIGPNRLFCDLCGVNSTTQTHAGKCPVAIAETAIARATKGEP